MKRFPVSALPLSKQKMLLTCGSSPRFYLTIERYGLSEFVAAIVYEIQVGIQEEHDVVVHTVSTRFSELHQLNTELQRTLTGSARLAPFPQKRWLGNTTKSFLQTRANGLQEFLSSLVPVRNMSQRPEFVGVFRFSNDS
jgi:hypothetical protein